MFRKLAQNGMNKLSKKKKIFSKKLTRLQEKSQKNQRELD